MLRVRGACPIGDIDCYNYIGTEDIAVGFEKLTLKQKENEVKGEYNLTIMDLVEGNRYGILDEDIITDFVFEPNRLGHLAQGDRFKKLPEVIETKFMLNGMDVVGIYRADLDYGSENIVEIKPLNAELTRWEVVK